MTGMITETNGHEGGVGADTDSHDDSNIDSHIDSHGDHHNNSHNDSHTDSHIDSHSEDLLSNSDSEGGALAPPMQPPLISHINNNNINGTNGSSRDVTAQKSTSKQLKHINLTPK